MTPDTKSLNRRILLATIPSGVRHVDHRLIPRLRILIKPALRGIRRDHLRIRRMRQTRLNRIQHLLRHLLRLGDNNDPHIRIHTNPEHRIVHCDARRLRMLRRHIHNRQVTFPRLPRDPRRSPAGLTPLHNIDDVIHVREHPHPQILLRELRERNLLPGAVSTHTPQLIQFLRPHRVFPTPPLIRRNRATHPSHRRLHGGTLGHRLRHRHLQLGNRDRLRPTRHEPRSNNG